MSTREELLELAMGEFNERIHRSQQEAVAAVVDALHDRLVGPTVEEWTWCSTCKRPVNVHRPFRHDGHSIPGDRVAICDGPLEVLARVRPVEGRA